MTTVVVTKKSGIACIAADTLATYGDMQESAELIANSDKPSASATWVASTGPASAQLVLKHFISTYEELPRLEDIDGIFDFLNVLQRALRDEYFVQEGGLTDDFESMRMELLIASPGACSALIPSAHPGARAPTRSDRGRVRHGRHGRGLGDRGQREESRASASTPRASTSGPACR